MTVEELIDILSKLSQEATVLFEYMPRAHEYISEIALGVRVEGDKVIIFGATDLLD